ncbi:MAG: hypothetical protein LCH95_24680 [Proteobacteria bacterium]|nr:hypothetical protein [Pseudomonadota bacterium]
MSVNNRGKKILLVDDDQNLRTVLAEQLDLYDGFTTIQVGSAAEGLEKAKQAHYDAILLDVDNGPEALTRRGNNWLYSENGISSAYFSLRLGGFLAVWSAGPDRGFTQRLHKVGYEVDVVPVRSRRTRGEMHTIWLARRDAGVGRFKQD